MSKRAQPLQPLLPGAFRARSVDGMSSMPMVRDQREMLERESLSIFTAMSNAGKPLHETLAAILLTGIIWGTEGLKELEANDE